MAGPNLITNNIESTFRALRHNNPQNLSKQKVSSSRDYPSVPSRNYTPISSVETGSWGNGEARFGASSGMFRSASVSGGGIVYGQPQFFSPVHTPINWQIPSKRLEEAQWARFFYFNEPKVASAIDFYSYFPMSDWSHECGNAEIKAYFDKFKKRLDLPRICRLISHEVHLLGNCFPLVEISCDICGGHGRIGDEICDHEGGTIKRVVILNPDNVDIYTSPLNPEPVIALKPNEELIDMVQRKTPGFEKLSPEVAQLIAAGQPIHLDNRSVAHLKYGECGYTKFGVGMVRRLFPILSYKTKLMVAQWIVAERLIIPIKVVKVGSDERPAGPADIADVQAQLAQTANDPSLTIVTHHAFELDWHGASSHVLTLSNEFEMINQEILDGMMINNALLNGEGPTFAAASVGIEAMIKRLNTFRQQIGQWLEDYLYLPEAKRQGFIEKDPITGNEEYIVPKIKWEQMHLRDQQQEKQFAIQLYDKSLLSAQTLLELFGYDPDQEIERKRYDSIQMTALGQGNNMGAEGGMMGMGDMGGMMGGDLGGAPPIASPGDMGGDMGGEAPPMAQSTTFQPEVVNIDEFGGKVLTKKTREKMKSDQVKMYQQQQRNQRAIQGPTVDSNGQTRDEKGRIIFTKPERQLLDMIGRYQKDGIIKYRVIPQFRIQAGSKEYSLDLAIKELRLGIEADGEKFHSDPKQKMMDQQRDQKLAQMGWTIVRFSDKEIDRHIQQVMQKIISTIASKEQHIHATEKSLPGNQE